MKCVILAAGSMLHREAPKSGAWPKEPKPKTLYHVRGEVLLELQVKILQKVGIRDIIVVVGYKKELIEQFVKKKNLPPSKIPIGSILIKATLKQIKTIHHNKL